MDFSAQLVGSSLFWYEKVTLLFALFYPVLGVLMTRRHLASGHGSVVALATLPLTAGAVAFWLGLSSVAGGLRFIDTEAIVVTISQVAMPLFVACLSTLLVLAGSLPYRTGGEERHRSNRLTLIVIAAPFVLAAAGLANGFVLSRWSVPPSSLAGTVLGAALVGLHLLAIRLRVPPESRATVTTVFVLTVLLAAATWQFSHQFRVEE
jgi:hypothetical protein